MLQTVLRCTLTQGVSKQWRFRKNCVRFFSMHHQLISVDMNTKTFIVLQMEGKSSTFTVALYLESELVPRNGYEVVKRIEPFTYF